MPDGPQAQVKRLVAAGGQGFADIRKAPAEAGAEQDAAERALALGTGAYLLFAPAAHLVTDAAGVER